MARRPAAISSSPRLPELVYPSADAPIASLMPRVSSETVSPSVSLSTTGTEEVLAILAEEARKTLLLMGVGGVAALGRDHLRRLTAVPR
ncbi:hypothetical protein [Mycolicibacterium sp. YH-1]|uniref:hypothetical protein n=1 Tax=Mycolicibacterium sp. YH-1 TaxID=2908837 RepID=UPI001F4C06F3|nr:hypothetical protein [Mycolicibacterium sp. YH-1]UNB55521.1 hypothetical protein L0M16_15135 [Mycolicibacterium sp. YH-1]